MNASNKSYAPVKFIVSFRYPELGQGSRDGERKYLGELSQEDLADKFLFANKKFLAAKAIKSTDTWKKAMTTSLDYSVIPGAAVSEKSSKEPHKYGIPEWMRYSSEEPQLESIPMVADSGDDDDGIISISSKSRTSRISQKSDHQSVLSLSSDEEDEWPRGSSNEIANEGRNGEVDDNSFTDYDDLGSPEIFGVHESDHSADAKNVHGQSRKGENHAIQSHDNQSEHDYWSPSYRSSPVAWHFSPDLSDYENESDEQQNNSDAAALFSASVQDEVDALENGNIGEAGYSGDKVNNGEILPQEPAVPQTQADKLASLDEDEQRESFYRAIAASLVEADGQGKALQFDSEPLQLSSDNVARLDSTNTSSEPPTASDFSPYGSEQAVLRNEKDVLTKKKAELSYSYENENGDEDEDHNDYDDDDEASRGDDMSIIYSSEEKEDDLDDRSSIEDEARNENSNCLIRERRPKQGVAPNKHTDDKLLTDKITMHVDTTIAQEVTTPSSSSEADSLDLPSSEGKKLDLHRDIEEEVAVFLEQSQQMLACEFGIT